MVELFCPYCNETNILELHNGGIGGLPPTGGDYEWIETDVKHSCSNCNKEFEIRIQIDIDSRKINKIRDSLKPVKEEIQWYAIANIGVDSWTEGCKSVWVKYLFKTETEARSKFESEKLNKNSFQILKVSSKGYFDLENQIILESKSSTPKILFYSY